MPEARQYCCFMFTAFFSMVKVLLFPKYRLSIASASYDSLGIGGNRGWGDGVVVEGPAAGEDELRP